MINNTVSIIGTVFTEPIYDHTVIDEKFYLFYINSTRWSGIPDVLPVIISEKLFDSKIEYLDMRVEIKGSFRSHSITEDGRSRKLLFIFAESMRETECSIDKNDITLEGCIYRTVVYRETPLDRQVADIYIAVNKSFGKKDYLPVIVWSRNAVEASTLPVGTKIKVNGRLQSRWYTKQLPDGQVVDRCYYEVSGSKFDVICYKGVDYAGNYIEEGIQDKLLQ